MKLNIRIIFAQSRPFVLRFLHAVFAKDALALLKQRFDPLRRMRLAYSDQRDVIRRAARNFRRLGDFLADFGERG